MNNEKQQQARNLYFQTELSKTQIADLLNISRRSLHYWIRENNWDRLKRSATHLPAMLAENCYMIISQFTTSLLSENRIMRPVTHQEAETLHKLSLTVKKLKNHSTLNESMEMFAHFMERICKKSPELADQISPFVEEYIEDWARVNPHQFRSDKFNDQGFIPIPDPNNPDEQQLAAIVEKQKDFADFMEWEKEAGLVTEMDLHDINAATDAVLSPEVATNEDMVANPDSSGNLSNHDVMVSSSEPVMVSSPNHVMVSSPNHDTMVSLPNHDVMVSSPNHDVMVSSSNHNSVVVDHSPDSAPALSEFHDFRPAA